jgi:hypothetical protein
MPGEPLQVGSVGTLREGVFECETQAADLGVSLRSSKRTGSTSFAFQSSEGVTTTFKASGDPKGAFQSIGVASAGVRFDFSRKGAVVFSAPKCTSEAFRDRRALERALKSVDDWRSDWLIVTKIFVAPQATILVSAGERSHVELRANADLTGPTVPLGEIAVGFSRARTSSMAVELIAEGNVPVLYEVSRLAYPRFSRDRAKRRLLIT